MPKRLLEWVPASIAMITSLAFFAMIGAMLYVPIPAANQSTIYLLAGGLLGTYTGVVGYYFGSSAGSAKKNETLAGVLGQTNKETP